jgi:hypothetical protein
MRYSLGAIKLARLILVAKEGRNDLEKFLIQQNFIQYDLMLLIGLRKYLLDKKFFDWLESQPLGKLIDLYKICSLKTDDEKLVNLLEQYNQKRKYLVHKILKDCDYEKSKLEAKATNKIGEKIMNILEDAFRKNNLAGDQRE